MRLLLLSNSTMAGEPFLAWPAAHVRDVLGGGVGEVLFVPFAAVRMTFDDYAARVRERFAALGYGVASLHEAADPVAAVERAEAIVVGGGNTFALVHRLYESGVVDAVRARVRAGAPYVGWSAGANVACPSLRTTNDMPIVEPATFRTFDLVPFQVNPHYTDRHPPGHAGETRADRIAEFVALNPGVRVLGLPEGTGVRVDGPQARLIGDVAVRLFAHGHEPSELGPGADVSPFLR